ncbi:MAG TPA: SDR family oxidoreductase [Bacteroidia bacterium]|nr:SDR family oxidoreductase [Bacteroidia bacterium]
MQKNILLVGATGYIAQNVIKTLGGKKEYNFIKAQRNVTNPDNELYLDFSDIAAVENFQLPEKMHLDGIFFLQGINPQKNTKEITYEHFLKMMQVNVIGPALLIKKLHPLINPNALVLFFSSIAAQKGSYDPSYAAAKSALTGLLNSLANEFSSIRFNSISLGLVENSPVEKGMTEDFKKRHKDKMFGNELIKVDAIIDTIELILKNKSICSTNVQLDGGFKI